jgi:4-hydroxyproline epimerase
VIATLSYMGHIRPGAHTIETPVGNVKATLHESGEVTVENVPSYRCARAVAVEAEGFGSVHGDIAWGGNWFFLVGDHGQEIAIDRVEHLTDYTWRIRQALVRNGITGANGAEIDHIELFGPPRHAGAHSRNFVLCPGKAYDRSPCGTGTSAKVACLAEDGSLAEGEIWRQESVVGTVFEASYRRTANGIVPSIKGRAHISAEARLIFEPADPFAMGIRR